MIDREIVFICTQPNSLYYIWQVNIWLESAKEYGISDKCQILVYMPGKEDKPLEEWKIVEGLYPEAKFFYYNDKGVNKLLSIYIPILRPHTLAQHFERFPELESKAIFYHDCDIILNRKLEIDKYINDDINYVSPIGSDYLSHIYFESKEEDVREDKKEEYSQINVLSEACELVGINKQIVVDNYDNTGGAQYVLKNINYKFWEEVQRACIDIRLYLKLCNRRYFENEDIGFQSWCSDMWAVLWILWKNGKETKKIDEMSFCWSTDTKDTIITHPILHNAGVTATSTIRTTKKDEFGQPIFVDAPAFYKGRYHTGSFTPFHDEKYVENILTHPTSKGYCFHTYLEKIIKIKNKYSLTY